MNIKPVYLIAGGAVALALAYTVWRGGIKSAAAGAAGAAVQVAEGVAVGTVEGIGSVVGIPKTNRTQCEIDKAKGDTWAASFSCPASDFIGYLFK